MYAILHNIRSLHNVGSMFRSADAAGVEKIYLTGYTPTPIDMFGVPREEIAKTALGAEYAVPWEKHQRAGTVLQRLKKEGIFLIAIEQDKYAVDYRRIKPKHPFALIVGNEVSGLSKPVMKTCDVVAEIPMRGTKESLNVSVAFGIALFELLKK